MSGSTLQHLLYDIGIRALAGLCATTLVCLLLAALPHRRKPRERAVLHATYDDGTPVPMESHGR